MFYLHLWWSEVLGEITFCLPEHCPQQEEHSWNAWLTHGVLGRWIKRTTFAHAWLLSSTTTTSENRGSKSVILLCISHTMNPPALFPKMSPNFISKNRMTHKSIVIKSPSLKKNQSINIRHLKTGTKHFFWPCHAACRISVPRPGIEPWAAAWNLILTTRPPGNS